VVSSAKLTAALALACSCASARLDSDNPYERHMALTALERSARLGAAARRALSDDDWRVAATACTLAIKRRLRGVAAAAVELLAARDVDDQRLEYLIRLAAEAAPKDAAATVAHYLGHPRPSVRAESLRALAPEHLGAPGRERWIIPLLDDRHHGVRARAESTLVRYATPEVRALLARRGRAWAILAEMGATRELYEALRTAAPASRAAIFEPVLRSPTSNSELVLAVLADASLAALHPAAVAYLERRKEAPDSLAQIKARIAEEHARRLAAEVARCSTAEWYPPYARLKKMAERPEYQFLAQRTAAALDACRSAALEVVSKQAGGQKVP
jgi:hypothetical protein